VSMNNLRFAFLGSTTYSKEMLLFLIKNNFIPQVIFYIPKKFKIKINGIEEEKINSNYYDLTKIAKEYNIPSYEVNSVNGKRLQDYENIIKNLKLDLILVVGWYYMIPKNIRDLAKYGAWGIHASLLPKYAGGAPLVWAIINREQKSGVTLFRMEDGIDDGDIILQKSFLIKYEDTIKEVYEKATFASKEILYNVFNNLEKITFIPQDKSKIEIFPQRKEEDGMINWCNKADNIYNFIRAQTIPYPCAFSVIKNKKIKIINSKVTEINSYKYKNGEIVEINNKILVATQDKFLELGIINENGKKYKFKYYVRINKLWGEVFKSKKY
jgi:methionyl-tRNA formyltransferase